ncbi:glycosyltransferase family 8 protein [Lasiosphaeria ovina]|uniref:Glycosyltransferase family 8 protein n=1 Tax=Lasiosphaeria ovina TaxID=92902 RepID=A0AAE0JXU3_9PEZI|nr:glycosyltransferase family 8 protein [Lasiosphaeria ovina]
MSDRKRAADSDKVWTCLITNNDYLPGLLTLDYSLKSVGSAYPLVVLYTDGFPASGMAALDARGIPRQRIKYLMPAAGGKDYSNDPRFYDCWSKLVPFSLTQYKRIVQLDADMLVLRNMDELMDLELDNPEEAAAETVLPGASGTSPEAPLAAPAKTRRVFAAGHACVCNPLGKAHYPRDWTPANCAFTSQHADPETAQTTAPAPGTAAAGPLGFMNGGLQVVNPSAALFAQIVAYMDADAARMDFADQSLLSGLYAGRWVALPYVYNALKTLRWHGVHAPLWRDGRVKNVHYILAPKPWDKEDESAAAGGRDDPTRGWWLETNARRKRSEKLQGLDDDGW